MTEAIVAGLENLLALHGEEEQAAALGDGGAPSGSGPPSGELLRLPEGDLKEVPIAHSVPAQTPLFVLTNRLNPLAIAARVLVNLWLRNRTSVRIETFLREAGTTARAVGQCLQAEDVRTGRKGLDKHHIGWPVGADAEKSLDRFEWSFLIWAEPRNGSNGPMADLGLAAVVGPDVYPTRVCLELATMRSPLLGETEGGTLGLEQQKILRELVAEHESEAAEVAVFLKYLDTARGSQEQLDRELQIHYEGWTPNRTVAHRAAMLGRLKDIGVVTVEGRGPTAHLSVTDIGHQFADEVATSGGEHDGASLGRDEGGS